MSIETELSDVIIIYIISLGSSFLLSSVLLHLVTEQQL